MSKPATVSTSSVADGTVSRPPASLLPPPHLAPCAAAVHAYSETGSLRAASMEWFREAAFGLFVHYNNTSLLPGSKYDPLPAGVTFEQLSARFRAERFDADAIAGLAVEAGARYVCFTPYHGGGPYLWDSAVGEPSSMRLPAGRDLVAELSAACARRGLGYFHYVHFTLSESHDAVWARNRALLTELGRNYGPVAGWWIDSAPHFHREPEKYPRLAETYALLRALQPHGLISFCEGVQGDEDYLTFEHRHGLPENAEAGGAGCVIAERHRGKPVEVCTTLQLDQPGGSGWRMWFNVERAYHRTADEAWAELAAARRQGTNFLLNTAPRADGSLHPADVETLRALGRRVRAEGLPGPITDGGEGAGAGNRG
ncbi:alpha-L-fucosidase [Opitutaceae bacterium TAV1]|nr:alpha-L-fucosidase [Opitutaceae bacterium TAV1]